MNNLKIHRNLVDLTKIKTKILKMLIIQGETRKKMKLLEIL